MSSCAKCGKHPLKKPKVGPRRCPHCGVSAFNQRLAQLQQPEAMQCRS